MNGYRWANTTRRLRAQHVPVPATHGEPRRRARAHRLLLALGLLMATLLASIPLAPSLLAAPTSPRDAHSTTRADATSDPPAESSKTILDETSIDGPALWTANPTGSAPALASVLAWTGTDPAHSLNILQSGDGITYSGKVIFDEQSPVRPAVAAQPALGIIVLAWMGADPNHTLNILCHGGSCGTEKKLILTGQNSFTSPALTPFGPGFLLSWVGTDPNHSLNILPFSLTSSGTGFSTGSQVILRQFSSVAAPSLTLDPAANELFLNWSATSPQDQLSFSTSTDGATWSAAQTLAETSATTPSGLAVATNNMTPDWIAWTGTDPNHTLNVRVTSSFPQWPLAGNKTILSDMALGGPVLGYVGNVGRVLLAWTGTDPAHHLNIATVTTIPLSTRIDNYIAKLSTAQQIGQTLVLSVYASGYNANLNQALTQWHVGNAIVFNNYNGGSLQPTTAAGMRQLIQALQSHADLPMLVATDEEGGTVDRLAPYYGSTPGARQLANTGNPQNAYNQAQTDAQRMRALGINVDFAPVVDVDQGGGEGSARMFGSSVSTVTTYAGAFLDGLQQNGIAGTLKHWPGLGAATGNPDTSLPTISASQAQMQAVEFAPFQQLLSRSPDLIMVTTVMVPSYDSKYPAMLSPTLVGTVLRGHLGYQGVVVTDALDAQGLIQYMTQQGYSNTGQGLGEAAVRAFLAGDDLIEAPIEQDRLAAVVSAMTSAVQSGRISPSRLQTSVHRILALKVRLGLLAIP